MLQPDYESGATPESKAVVQSRRWLRVLHISALSEPTNRNLFLEDKARTFEQTVSSEKSFEDALLRIVEAR